MTTQGIKDPDPELNQTPDIDAINEALNCQCERCVRRRLKEKSEELL